MKADCGCSNGKDGFAFCGVGFLWLQIVGTLIPLDKSWTGVDPPPPIPYDEGYDTIEQWHHHVARQGRKARLS